MGYPQKLLSAGEEIEIEFRPHWSQILKEGLLTVMVAALIILVATLSFDAKTWVIAALIVLWFVVVVAEFVRWWTTQHVITNERLIYRTGLISKKGTEIPLEVINDVTFKQSMIERIFGSGDLMIESAGTHGQSAYTNIPHPEKVQKLIYEARETRMAEMRSGGAPSASRAGSVTELETLSRLHDEGKLTTEEFEAQKRKLLGEG
ncbi:MAG TPA: PH domain-containing protein [Acidimicrobiia bacterium]|nr:PH domain-containing protein [Acidimicrobiia bacterium]